MEAIVVGKAIVKYSLDFVASMEIRRAWQVTMSILKIDADP
jgi:hypothetical protein